MRVDMHCHLAHPDYLREFARLVERGDPLAMRGAPLQRRAQDPALWSAELLFDEMERHKVDVGVLSMHTPSVFFHDRGASLALAQLTNDYYAELARKHPGRFWGFAALPMLHADAALDELARAIDRLGLQGIGLGGTIGGYALDDPRFARVFAEINRRRLPVFIHPMGSPADALFRDFSIDVLLGFVTDTSLGVLRFILSGARDRYPNFPLIMPHLGGTLLYLQGRLDDLVTHAAPGAGGAARTRPPSAYLADFYYDVVSHHKPALQCAAATVGPDHLLLGSDYPWVREGLKRSIDDVLDFGWSPAEADGILGGNAARLLNRRQPSG